MKNRLANLLANGWADAIASAVDAGILPEGDASFIAEDAAQRGRIAAYDEGLLPELIELAEASAAEARMGAGSAYVPDDEVEERFLATIPEDEDDLEDDDAGGCGCGAPTPFADVNGEVPYV